MSDQHRGIGHASTSSSRGGFPSTARSAARWRPSRGCQKLKRHYIRRFDGAAAVAGYVAEQFRPRLSAQTRLWVQTWYDSTLPYWFLDRVMVPVNCLATQAFHAFDNGRYWGWEGVDCCPGTCQHVWQYAQSVARLFPAIERDLRERVDFGLAWHDSGAMDFRSENDRHVAHDGFCGTIVRAYREHQMAPDSSFLTATLAADQAVDRVHHGPGPGRRRPARGRADEHARHRLVRADGLDQLALPRRALGGGGHGRRDG